jgi:hypothetical protein
MIAGPPRSVCNGDEWPHDSALWGEPVSGVVVEWAGSPTFLRYPRVFAWLFFGCPDVKPVCAHYGTVHSLRHAVDVQSNRNAVVYHSPGLADRRPSLPWVRCQDSLFSDSGTNRTRGRPRGRRVDASPSRWAVASSQEDSPKGLPRCTDRRTAANSRSVSGWFTFATQCGQRGSGSSPHRRWDATPGASGRASIRTQTAAPRSDSVHPRESARTPRNRPPCGKSWRAHSLDSRRDTARWLRPRGVVVTCRQSSNRQSAHQ